MAYNEDGDAQPIGQDCSSVGHEGIHEPVAFGKGSVLMDWNQFFIQFRNQVRKPTADLLSHVETIGKYA